MRPGERAQLFGSCTGRQTDHRTHTDGRRGRLQGGREHRLCLRQCQRLGRPDRPVGQRHSDTTLRPTTADTTTSPTPTSPYRSENVHRAGLANGSVQQDGLTGRPGAFPPEDARISAGMGRAAMAPAVAMSRETDVLSRALDADGVLVEGALYRDIETLTPTSPGASVPAWTGYRTARWCRAPATPTLCLPRNPGGGVHRCGPTGRTTHSPSTRNSCGWQARPATEDVACSWPAKPSPRLDRRNQRRYRKHGIQGTTDPAFRDPDELVARRAGVLKGVRALQGSGWRWGPRRGPASHLTGREADEVGPGFPCSDLLSWSGRGAVLMQPQALAPLHCCRRSDEHRPTRGSPGIYILGYSRLLGRAASTTAPKVTPVPIQVATEGLGPAVTASRASAPSSWPATLARLKTSTPT